LLIDYYPEFSNVLKSSVRQMHRMQHRTLAKASQIVFSSTWAAQSAVEDYHADPQKVHVVPFGANLERPPAKERVLQRQKSRRCRLLFVGVDWQRKGGDIAFETLRALDEMGIQAELIICGCTPPKSFSHERMKVIPFLDKNDERQRKELDDLYMNADFFLVPSRQEGYGIVFCEASAFGLPIITTNTGGISEIVEDGENGFLLPLDARGVAYAEVIADVYRDDQRYIQLMKGARAAFDRRLNWDAWGVAVKEILTQLLDAESSSS
jgi:glycosyltransferase involved in cell wall biosynthesis